jgi:hypothetical protein
MGKRNIKPEVKAEQAIEDPDLVLNLSDEELARYLVLAEQDRQSLIVELNELRADDRIDPAEYEKAIKELESQEALTKGAAERFLALPAVSQVRNRSIGELLEDRLIRSQVSEEDYTLLQVVGATGRSLDELPPITRARVVDAIHRVMAVAIRNSQEDLNQERVEAQTKATKSGSEAKAAAVLLLVATIGFGVIGFVTKNVVFGTLFGASFILFIIVCALTDGGSGSGPEIPGDAGIND